MVFRGGPVLTLDGKGRITVPARWRDVLMATVQGQMVVAKNPDGPYLGAKVGDSYQYQTYRQVESQVEKLASGLIGLKLDAGAILDFQLQADNTITARQVKPDARRIRGLLKSAHAAPLTVEQMDEALAKRLREKHAPSQAARKSAGR